MPTLPAAHPKALSCRNILMLFNCFAVGAGGFAGAVFRYLIGLVPVLQKGILPYQTLLVNVAGAILIGVIVRYGQTHTDFSPQMMLFLKTGVCGGFTTFSTFTLESAGMIQQGNHLIMFLYAAASVCLCLGGVFLGQALVR